MYVDNCGCDRIEAARGSQSGSRRRTGRHGTVPIVSCLGGAPEGQTASALLTRTPKRHPTTLLHACAGHASSPPTAAQPAVSRPALLSSGASRARARLRPSKQATMRPVAGLPNCVQLSGPVRCVARAEMRISVARPALALAPIAPFSTTFRAISRAVPYIPSAQQCFSPSLRPASVQSELLRRSLATRLPATLAFLVDFSCPPEHLHPSQLRTTLIPSSSALQSPFPRVAAMSYYNDSTWAGPTAARQTSWEQPQPPSRSGASSTVNRDEVNAFASQLDEVDRACENLAKSGKPFGPGFAPPNAGGRRESMPMMGGGGGGGGPRPYQEYDQRMGGPQRHHSVSEYDGTRSHSASNVQGFYQNQRYAPRPNDADQMAQAKRRMAAQRERELRNYHQEQQYHRNVSGSKSDRSMSPNTMNEDDRRELIARQHRALYGETSSLYNNNPTSSQDVRVQTSGAGRGQSPLAFDPFGMQAQNASGESAVQMPPRDKDATGGSQEARANSNSSPNQNQNPAFALFDAQQANRTSNSSPGGSPPVSGQNKPNGPGVAPIGTRPAQGLQQPAGAPMGKRATSPLPSPLGYNSYNASEQSHPASTSASLNPSSTATDKGVGIWNNGPWSNTPNQGVQASVWG